MQPRRELVGSLGEGGDTGFADEFGGGCGRDVVEGAGRGGRVWGLVVVGGGEAGEFGFGSGNWSAAPGLPKEGTSCANSASVAAGWIRGQMRRMLTA